MVVALIALGIGTYGYLDLTVSRTLSWSMLGLGLLAATAALASAGRRVNRTRYEPTRWRTAEFLTALCGVSVAFGLKQLAPIDLLTLFPPVNAWPSVEPIAVLVITVGALPAVVTPAPPVLSRHRTVAMATKGT